MVSCKHESCGREQRIWLPIGHSSASDTLLHPWCIHCGQVKNVSDDRGKKQGYWMNVLSQLCHRYHITKVQKRLIVNELIKDDEFLDTYGITGSAQKKRFISIIQKHTRVSPQEINALLC